MGYDSHRAITKMLDNLEFGDESKNNSQLLQTTEIKFRTRKSKTFKSLWPLQEQFEKMSCEQSIVHEERNISKINRRVMLPPPGLISKAALFQDINEVAEAMLQMQETVEEPMENHKENISNNKPVENKIGIGQNAAANMREFAKHRTTKVDLDSQKDLLDGIASESQNQPKAKPDEKQIMS